MGKVQVQPIDSLHSNTKLSAPCAPFLPIFASMSSPLLYAFEPNRPAAVNMDRDESMALACSRDQMPRLRLYSWAPWSISLGHHQRVEEIDLDAVAARGYHIVRRPTGGRAVLHAEELTYAVAMSSNGEGIQMTYARISEAIRSGLEMLGATGITFERSQPDFRAHYELDEAANCFSASALNELLWQGRKLVGSAQRRYDDILLQHGSILLDTAHLDIVHLLASAGDETRRERMSKLLAARTATVREVLNGELPSLATVACSVRDGFARTLSLEIFEVEDIVAEHTINAIHTSIE